MEFSKLTQVPHRRMRIRDFGMDPEALPLFASTAFSYKNLTEVKKAYDEKKFTYIRARNPNRAVLADAVSYLENAEDSYIAGSGMGAITATLFGLLQSGDHIICNASVYGETFEIMELVLPKLGIEVDIIDFQDIDHVKALVKPNTKVIYTEVASNPCIVLSDIPAYAKLAHDNGAYLVIDNTFTTPFAICPLDFGADVSINSLTKFINGHSDCLGGSASASRELVERITFYGKIMGTPCDPYDAWMIYRGMQTAGIRITKQLDNAAKLAVALEKNPHVQKVNHPVLESHHQHELAGKLFRGDRMTPMLSFEIPEDMDAINRFMERLQLAHYAMTLGGVRTTMSNPVVSSHNKVPDDVRRALGITPGLFRVSVGIEEPEDLIADFENALAAFDR